MPRWVKTTSFRLALVHSSLFVGFSVFVLGYLYFSTVGFLEARSQKQLQDEARHLQNIYNLDGSEAMSRAISDRIAVKSEWLYFWQTAPDVPYIGDFNTLPKSHKTISGGRILFEYELKRPDLPTEIRLAEGIQITFSRGEVLLVAMDREDFHQIHKRINQMVWTASGVGLILSFLGGFLVSRYASQRAEILTRTADGVIAGDLTRRAPVSGSGDEFDRLSERLNAMLDRIERLMAASRHSGEAIAHDLRSPLTRLRNWLDSAGDEIGDTDQAMQVLEQARNEADEILATFDAVLRLSRLEAGEQGKFTPVDVSEIAEELAELYQPVCEDKSVAFNAEIVSGLKVIGDRHLLAQAFSNLLDNAVKYTQAGDAMTLRARRQRNGEVELSITDTGPGIPQSKRAEVVKRFIRLEESRTKPGVGLGLSLVAAIAESHKGRLELSDGPGARHKPGLRAAIILPRR